MTGSTLEPTPAQTLDERYGRRSIGRRRLIGLIVAGVVVLAAIGWFAYASIAGAASATGTTIGFHVVDDATTTVTFDVTKPAKDTATCTVEALDSAFATVGTTQARIGPGRHSSVELTVTVRTTNRATSGQVTDCSVVH